MRTNGGMCNAEPYSEAENRKPVGRTRCSPTRNRGRTKLTDPQNRREMVAAFGGKHPSAYLILTLIQKTL